MTQRSLHNFFAKRLGGGKSNSETTRLSSASDCGNSSGGFSPGLSRRTLDRTTNSPTSTNCAPIGSPGAGLAHQQHSPRSHASFPFDFTTEKSGPKTPSLNPVEPGHKKRTRESSASETRHFSSPGENPSDCNGQENSTATGSQSLGFGANTSSGGDATKRARFIEVLGEEDYAAAGNEGAWAEARKNIAWLHPSKVKDGNGKRPGDPGYDKRTVTIPHSILASKSKSQKQYWETKCKYMDTVIFFKVGKFYELYELDAEIGHRELDWKLTISGVGKCLQVGVPESGIDDAVRKLVSRGYKVGRMEQVETGEEAKAKRGPQAMVNRVLTQVQTPATLSAGDAHPEAIHLLAIKEVNLSEGRESSQGPDSFHSREGGAVILGFAFVDASAGKFYVGSFCDDSSRAALQALMMQVSPQELIYELGAISTETRRTLRSANGPGLLPMQVTPMQTGKEFLDPSEAVQILDSMGIFQPENSGSQDSIGNRKANQKGGLTDVLSQVAGEGDAGLAASALGALVCHLERLKLDTELLPHGELLPYEIYSGSLRLDGQTLRNLELLENSDDGGKEGTLLGYLDSCATPAGKRLLRRWICHPLQSVQVIEERLDAVDELIARPHLAGSLWSALKKIPDLERLVGRTRSMAATPGLGLVPMAANQTHQRRLRAFATTVKGLMDACDLLSGLKRGFDGDGPPTSALLLAAARIADNTPAVQRLEEVAGAVVWPKTKKERVKLQIEVPSQQDSEEADETELEAQLLSQLLACFNEHTLTWAAVAEALARTDVLISFAAAASTSGGSTCRPTFISRANHNAADRSGVARTGSEQESSLRRNRTTGRNTEQPTPDDAFASPAFEPSSSRGRQSATRQTSAHAASDPDSRTPDSSQRGGVLAAIGLWHPYAVSQGGGSVVSNDVNLGGREEGAEEGEAARAMLLTGPNMGGKSTLLRATCLAVTMAQLGCHVAAESFTLTPVDTIFTRLGASDRIMAGESTFMVECNEAASVLRHASPDSLVVLDELGRGTSTFDGYAIAYAVLKHLTETLDCRLLFATHYHPLTAEFAHSPRVSLRHMACMFRSSSAADRLPTPSDVPPQERRFLSSTSATCSDGLPLEGRGVSADGDQRQNRHSTDRKSTFGQIDGSYDSSHVRAASKPVLATTPTGDQLVFLYKLREGACPKSYGLQVATLAGIPPNIVAAAARAAEAMQGQLDETFDAATYGEGLRDLHKDWLKGTYQAASTLGGKRGVGGLGYGNSGDGAEVDEDAMDTLLCIWSEIRKSAI